MMNDLEQKVKYSNKVFYDIVGDSYEEIDGRRSEKLSSYVSEQIAKTVQTPGGGPFLDLGCGSGFVAKIAKNYYRPCYAADLSLNILKSIDDDAIAKMTADSDMIPVKTNTLKCVVTFATLHHCYSFEKMFKEIYRVLKKGGIYYSDHDMDDVFFKRFKLLLKVYRKINDAGKRYRSRFKQISEEMYDHSEFHKEGIPTDHIEAMLKGVGFEKVDIQYHWLGLSPATDRIFGKKVYKRGLAPIVRIIATK